MHILYCKNKECKKIYKKRDSVFWVEVTESIFFCLDALPRLIKKFL